MQRAREEAYLRGAHEGKMFMLATGRSYRDNKPLIGLKL
jgi:hydroxymethylpyrimidine pyrophosphatase-like HAD family hydrolase